MKSYYKLLIVFFLGGIFLFLALQNLNLPGYRYEEAIEAMPILCLLQNKPIEKVKTIKIFKKDIPYRLNEVQGSTQSYFLIPVFKIFGINYISSRLLPIFFAFIAILLNWYLCQSLFNWRTALIATILLSFNSSYVLWSKVGLLTFGPFLNCLLLAMFIFLVQWQKKAKAPYLYLAAFIAGIGLATRMIFLMIIIAFVVAGVIWYRDTHKRPNKKEWLFAVLFFLLGSSPLIYFNLADNFPTLRLFFSSITGLTPKGANNLNLPYSFLVRCKHFVAIMGGGAYDFSGDSMPNSLTAVIFLCAYVYLGRAILKKDYRLIANKNVKMLLIIQAVIFFSTCFTVSNFKTRHLLILFPLPFITMAVFFDYVGNIYKKMARTLVVALIAGLVIIDTYVIFNKYWHLRKTGGEGLWSDAIYKLTDYLKEEKISNLIVMDWGIKENIRMLTGGEVNIIEASDSLTHLSDDFLKRAKGYLSKPGNYYVFIADKYAQDGKRVGYYESFKKLVKDRNLHLKLIKEFKTRIGEPVYLLYSLKKGI